MNDREIIFRVYFKCGTKYDFLVGDASTMNGSLDDYWDMAALWCEGVVVDTVAWIHSILSQDPWVPNIKDNDQWVPAIPGMRDLYDQPTTFEADAAYVLVEYLGRDSKQEVIIQYKDNKLTRLDDPVVRFTNNLSPVF